MVKHRLTYAQKEKKLKLSVLTDDSQPQEVKTEYDSEFLQLKPIHERIQEIFHLMNKNTRPAGNILFFVMYDISNNRVRNLIAKYLIDQGCVRVQRSIFLADLPSDKYDKIRSDLAEVQSAYENIDSILIVPISESYLESMKIIGQEVNLDLILHRKNTLFF